MQAIAEWSKLIASGIEPESINRGLSIYETQRLKELKDKGRVIGVPHGVRFLKNRLFQDAIDEFESESSSKSEQISDDRAAKWNELRSRLAPFPEYEVYVHTDGDFQELRARHAVSGVIKIERYLLGLAESLERSRQAESSQAMPF